MAVMNNMLNSPVFQLGTANASVSQGPFSNLVGVGLLSETGGGLRPEMKKRFSPADVAYASCCLNAELAAKAVCIRSGSRLDVAESFCERTEHGGCIYHPVCESGDFPYQPPSESGPIEISGW